MRWEIIASLIMYQAVLKASVIIMYLIFITAL